MEMWIKLREKMFPTGALLNLMGKRRGVSFHIISHRYAKDSVEVLVRGKVGTGILSDPLVDEEWVLIDIPTLADQFCLEKYGYLPDRRSLEWKREYIRAKLVATRYAVGLAKKRIELRFAQEEFRDLAEREAEKNELSNIYLRVEDVRKRAKNHRKTIEHMRKLREEAPEVYKEVVSKFGRDIDTVEFRTPEQNKKLHILLKELGMSEEEYRTLLKERYGVSSSLALTKQEASELISELEKRKEEVTTAKE